LDTPAESKINRPQCFLVGAAFAVCFVVPSYFFFLSHYGSANLHEIDWERKFDAVDGQHSGHLTNDELYKINSELGKHFAEIDYNGKGYVTKNDIRAWRAERARQEYMDLEPDPLSPRAAFYGQRVGETRL
jgi:hypothetical protein